MTELTNEQKARVFAMYWGCRAYRVVRKTGELTERDDYSPVNPDLMEYINKSQSTWSYKLCLTPLSAISDEDAAGLGHISYGDPKLMSWSEIGKGIVSDYLKRGIDPSPAEYIYLIEKGYAVPLWNDGCNGRTAIELGLAIDKTTLK